MAVRQVLGALVSASLRFKRLTACTTIAESLIRKLLINGGFLRFKWMSIPPGGDPRPEALPSRKGG